MSCTNDNPEQLPSKSSLPEQGEPPFKVSAQTEHLLFTWFDEEGTHITENIDDIPTTSRKLVRVDSLQLGPEQKLPPQWVWVADLTSPLPTGDYPVTSMLRKEMEQSVDKASGYAEKLAQLEKRKETLQQAKDKGEEVSPSSITIYGADWCGVCRAAAKFFKKKNVPFVEKNIEKNSEARQEMIQKLSKAGMAPGGIPVIDFRGTITQGFDEKRFETLLRNSL